MAGGTNVYGRDFDEIVRAVFESTDSALVVAPTAEMLETVVDVSAAADGGPDLRVLADSGVLKQVTNDFVAASNAADEVASGRLSIRATETENATSLVVADDVVWAVVATDTRVAALAADDTEFVADVAATYEDRWEGASTFDLRTPPMSRIRETLAEDVGDEVRADFDATLDALRTVREGSDAFDEVMLTLLVAARNDVLLYDVSKWGEDVGIASKATFSRTKTTLEEEGLVRTEKVPIDIGRPRLRLKLNEELFEEASPMELAAVTLNHSE